jgi:hypothetical protein
LEIASVLTSNLWLLECSQPAVGGSMNSFSRRSASASAERRRSTFFG